ncbi:hypothetical protein GCM10010121_097660 [Streptomyces brasiliensis]|uniref:Uncharacterized protein n=1 Tax=Streptomyces brasiliensis TaxID=1954 RepID=A0A917UNT2_9ACTN|nr:hypothetical protein GCM10010121_097660 [Streptomyces brasiliensis]
MSQPNKDLPSPGRWLRRTARSLREWPKRQGRTVYRQMLRGASYSLGSCAVSAAVVWFQTHH